MASRAASKLLTPLGRLCSDGLKDLVGAVKGPLARSQARYNCSTSTENSLSNSNRQLTVAEHEKAIGELKNKYDKAISDIKQGFDRDLVILRYDLKKEADERSLKNYIDMTNVKNEMKALEGRITTHELKIELQFKKEEILRWKTYGLFVGAGTAIMSRFSQLPDLIFKTPKGDK